MYKSPMESSVGSWLCELTQTDRDGDKVVWDCDCLMSMELVVVKVEDLLRFDVNVFVSWQEEADQCFAGKEIKEPIVWFERN